MESLTMCYYTFPLSVCLHGTKVRTYLLQNANTLKCRVNGGKLLHWLISQNLMPFQVSPGEIKRCNYALGAMMLSTVYAETTCPVLTSLKQNVIYLAYTKVYFTVEN